jgi:hypothetical protein
MSDFQLFERHYTENFSTALVVFAARQSPDFAGKLLKLILNKAGYPEGEKYAVESIVRNFPIQIDATAAARFPDISIKGKVDGEACIVLVEAKIGAGEGLDQLGDDLIWLGKQKTDYPIAKLASLTRDPLATRVRVDAALTWSDLVPLARQIAVGATSQFEKRFWSHLAQHLEAIMSTFKGFSTDFSDVHQLMQEVDLLLISLFRNMGVTYRPYWYAQCVAYWLPERKVTVGFWWWKRFGDPDRQNALIVWRDGKPEGRLVSSLQEVIEKANRARQQGQLADFINDLKRQVERAYQAEVSDS